MVSGPFGFRAQNMDGRKAGFSTQLTTLAGIVDTFVAGATGSITAPYNCVATCYAFGPGASAAYEDQAPAFGGGGGGGFAAIRFAIAKGQVISYANGTPGAVAPPGSGLDATDTTITLPDGRVLRGGGGKGGTSAAGGAGGGGSGGSLNRSGGAGGATSSGNSASPGGGLGGVIGPPSSVISGGGAGAGIGDITVGLTGGNGGGQSTLGAPTAPGGGAGSYNSTPDAPGALGRVLIVLTRGQ